MQTTIIKTIVDRKTGNVLEKCIIGYEGVDEKAYWEPLLAALHKDFELRKETF